MFVVVAVVEVLLLPLSGPFAQRDQVPATKQRRRASNSKIVKQCCKGPARFSSMILLKQIGKSIFIKGTVSWNFQSLFSGKCIVCTVPVPYKVFIDGFWLLCQSREDILIWKFEKKSISYFGINCSLLYLLICSYILQMGWVASKYDLV